MDAPDTPARRTGPHPEPAHDGSGLKHRLFHVIFESDTAAGRAFDVALILAILASVVVVMIDSIPGISPEVREAVWVAEWGFTLAFTVEYLLRLWVVERPSRYARSFFGVVDLLAILPTYAALILPGAQYLLTIRVLRVLRIFRVLRLAHFIGEANMITDALKASRHKIAIFLFAVLTSVTVLGSLLYVIEGSAPGSEFDSIPRAVYWAIVTLTTVGFGDITPRTPLGQTVAAVIMLLGYGMIAVPTGIFTAEMGRVKRRPVEGLEVGTSSGTGTGTGGRDGVEAGASGAEDVEVITCPECGRVEDDPEARFCRRCGARLRGG